MSTNTSSIDSNLVERLQSLDDSFWDARGRNPRDDMHALFQYPAMMVPLHQNEIVRIFAERGNGLSAVLDPFVGAGTTLTACLREGVPFVGQDLNPLAVLVCKVKATYYDAAQLRGRLHEILRAAHHDTNREVEAEFDRLDKWFTPNAVQALGRLRRAIRYLDDLSVRRFFWACMAETARLTSNSRTSTYKLHLRPQAEIAKLPDPLTVFKDVAERAIADTMAFWSAVGTRTQSQQGVKHDLCTVVLGDTSQSAPPPPAGLSSYDLVLTSPPYGDNTSTVPYGQHSYLPLQWIDLEDIDPDVDGEILLRTTQQIDRLSIGGHPTDVDDSTIDQLCGASNAFAGIAASLGEQPRDRLKRVAAYCEDLNRTLDPIVSMLRPGGYMVWFIGNRHVGGSEVPTDQILKDLLSSRGVSCLWAVERKLSFRRMATRNRISGMMRKEHILLMRKDWASD